MCAQGDRDAPATWRRRRAGRNPRRGSVSLRCREGVPRGGALDRSLSRPFHYPIGALALSEHEPGERRLSHDRRLGAFLAQVVAEPGGVERGCNVGGKLVDDCSGGARTRTQAIPDREVVTRDSRLIDRRDVWQQWRASGRGDSKPRDRPGGGTGLQLRSATSRSRPGPARLWRLRRFGGHQCRIQEVGPEAVWLHPLRDERPGPALAERRDSRPRLPGTRLARILVSGPTLASLAASRLGRLTFVSAGRNRCRLARP